METLFKFLLQQKISVVFGNLARNPLLLHRHLAENYPTLEILVKSDYIPFPESGNIHVNTLAGKCDLLIYLEPPANMNIINSSHIARTVIFTSHLLFNTPSDETTHVCYYHGSDLEKDVQNSIDLIRRQDNSVTHRNTNIWKNFVKSQELKTLSTNQNADYLALYNKEYPKFYEDKVYIVVDLSHVKTSFEAFIDLLYIFEVLKYNSDRIINWVICFPDRMLEEFEYLVQRHVDKLCCVDFSLGNVKNKWDLIRASPFQTVNANEVKTQSNIKVVNGFCIFNPKTDVEKYNINLSENLLGITDQLWVKYED